MPIVSEEEMNDGYYNVTFSLEETEDKWLDLLDIFMHYEDDFGLYEDQNHGGIIEVGCRLSRRIIHILYIEGILEYFLTFLFDTALGIGEGDPHFYLDLLNLGNVKNMKYKKYFKNRLIKCCNTLKARTLSLYIDKLTWLINYHLILDDETIPIPDKISSKYKLWMSRRKTGHRIGTSTAYFIYKLAIM